MLERQPYNAAGQCKVTGDYIFDVIRSYNMDSPLAGRSVEIGEPKDNAECCWFLRTSGELTQVSICTEALDEGINFCSLHREIIAGLIWETMDTNRLLIGATPLTRKQRESSLSVITKQFNAPIIALYTRQRWIDIKLREKVTRNA